MSHGSVAACDVPGMPSRTPATSTAVAPADVRALRMRDAGKTAPRRTVRPGLLLIVASVRYTEHCPKYVWLDVKATWWARQGRARHLTKGERARFYAGLRPAKAATSGSGITPA